jgi:hypothetical protein
LIFGGAIFAGIFGIDTRQSLSFQVFTLAASVLLIATISAFFFRSNFRIKRKLPQYGTVGIPMKYNVLIENQSDKWQQELILIDDLNAPIPDFSEFKESRDPRDRKRNWFDRKVGYPRLMGLIRRARGGDVDSIALDDIAPISEIEVNMNLLPSRRGYVHFDRLRIAQSDPMGLVRGMKKFPRSESILILPKTYRVPKIELPGQRKYQKGGLNMASNVGDSQEFMSLRDYRPGDPMKDIHWRSFAKRGHPVVKEFHDEFYVRQGLLLDTFIENKPKQLFEEGVSVAASLAISLQTQDALLDLMFVGNKTYKFTSGRGLAETENTLEILACVESCDTEKFKDTETLVSSGLHETSGLLCVLLDWDDKRKRLISKITAQKIPTLVFLITKDENYVADDLSALGNHPERFIPLCMTDIQNAIDHAAINGLLT